MNIMHDPSFTEIASGATFGRNDAGTLYAPNEVIASIEDTLDAGIDFDSIFIAHEVPRNSVSSTDSVDLKTLLPPPSPRARKRRDFRERSLVSYWNELLRLSKRAFGMMGKAAAGTVALAAAAPLAAAPLAGLDPVLFGVNYDENIISGGRPVGLFYYITHWRWK
jgi:hypothetical protein